ncbi:MAG TPA: CBS domain-containing protein [Bacilli bacterium]
MKTVKELMTTDCVTVSQNDTFYEVSVKMRDHDIGFIPVVEGRNLIGVVTDRDLVVRGIAEGRTESSTVSGVISKEIRSISPDTTIEEAARIMANGQIRRLPVVENGELLGVVALGDLAIHKNYENEAGEALSQISEPTPAEQQNSLQ